jgi:hypothetical protein
LTWRAFGKNKLLIDSHAGAFPHTLACTKFFLRNVTTPVYIHRAKHLFGIVPPMWGSHEFRFRKFTVMIGIECIEAELTSVPRGPLIHTALTSLILTKCHSRGEKKHRQSNCHSQLEAFHSFPFLFGLCGPKLAQNRVPLPDIVADSARNKKPKALTSIENYVLNLQKQTLPLRPCVDAI